MRSSDLHEASPRPWAPAIGARAGALSPRTRGALVGGVALGLAGLTAARLLLGHGGPAAGDALARTGLVLDGVAALAAAGGARTASRLARSERSRRAWHLQAAAALAWSLAPVVWISGLPPEIATTARAAFVVLATGAWWLTSRASDPRSRVRLIADGAIVQACVVAVGWEPLLRHVWQDGGGGFPGTVAVAIPLGTAGAATLGIGLATTEIRPGHRLMPVLYAASLIVIAGSDVAASGWTPLWAVGWALAWLATRVYLGTSTRATVLSTRRALVYAPYLLVVPTGLAVGIEATRRQPTTPQLVASVIVVALLLLRQHVTLLENRRLVVRLEAAEHLLRHKATHDSLTGLPGRAVLWEGLEAAAARRRAEPLAVSVVFLDLDDFKAVNDTHGHAAGDAVLVEVARRLRAALARHGGDAVAVRMSGDEFAVLLVGDPAQDSSGTAHGLLEVLAAPMMINGTPLTVGSSIGVAVADEGELSPSALLRAADVAMYDVKHSGKGDVRVARADRPAGG